MFYRVRSGATFTAPAPKFTIYFNWIVDRLPNFEEVAVTVHPTRPRSLR